MNSFEREHDNKERRRVVYWLAGGAAALAILGVVAITADAVTPAPASASERSASQTFQVGNTDSIISTADLAAFTSTPVRPTPKVTSSAEVATDTQKSATGSVSPASDPVPSPTPTPTPVPTPDPTPSPDPSSTHEDSDHHDGHDCNTDSDPTNSETA